MPVEVSSEVAASLKQIRTLLSGDDFMEKCAESPDMAKDILQRLCSLPLNTIPASIARVVIEFEAFFTRFSRDLIESQLKKTHRAQLYNQINAEWDNNMLREQKANQLYSQIQGQQKSQYLSQIEELQKKVAQIDEEKVKLSSVESLPQEETVDQEAQAGIIHARQPLALQKSAAALDYVILQLDARLVHKKELFVELLGKFPI